MKLYVFVLVDIALGKGIKYLNFCLDILSFAYLGIKIKENLR